MTDSPTGFDAHYGLQLDETGPDEMRAHVDIDERHLQPAGLVHGGLYASIAESLASYGTWLGNQDRFVAGLSNQTSFLRPILGGTIHAEARRRHRGRTTAVWEVDITDAEGRLRALVRVTTS